MAIKMELTVACDECGVMMTREITSHRQLIERIRIHGWTMSHDAMLSDRDVFCHVCRELKD